MKDKDKKLRKFQFHHTPKSDPTSPAAGSSKEPPPTLDLSKVLSGGSKKKKGTPPHTPTKLGFDSDSIFKPRINRTASTGSHKQKKYTAPLMDDTNLHTMSPVPAGAGTPVGPCASPTSGTPAGPLTPKASRGSLREAGTSSGPFEKPKSKFKMAHESFRIRMFQEQYGFEPVFMTKKRTADSKFSEFKGGDLNKYTARSYTIKNGIEVFGALLATERTLKSEFETICTSTYALKPQSDPGTEIGEEGRDQPEAFADPSASAAQLHMHIQEPAIRVEKFRHYPTKYYNVYQEYDEGLFYTILFIADCGMG
ncbi:unnamed protein product [Bursaphelenchus xylophilus]|uniref:(pine wood nematode) hypothetical protein n=1 Tax=Bursaphelenchus xylophilus TaxID=6326 RepID=A0A1I7SF80_BURXY|nr:unnamed protein product [Bursaphelenchus xylophilus]CAG9130484.1 unnamed protein product [Bursaphelenchus xylophilus]